MRAAWAEPIAKALLQEGVPPVLDPIRALQSRTEAAQEIVRLALEYFRGPVARGSSFRAVGPFLAAPIPASNAWSTRLPDLDPRRTSSGGWSTIGPQT